MSCCWFSQYFLPGNHVGPCIVTCLTYIKPACDLGPWPLWHASLKCHHCHANLRRIDGAAGNEYPEDSCRSDLIPKYPHSPYNK